MMFYYSENTVDIVFLNIYYIFKFYMIKLLELSLNFYLSLNPYPANVENMVSC